MPPTNEPAAAEITLSNEITLSKSAGDMAVVDSAAPLFGIALGMVAMIVLALNALAY